MLKQRHFSSVSRPNHFKFKSRNRYLTTMDKTRRSMLTGTLNLGNIWSGCIFQRLVLNKLSFQYYGKLERENDDRWTTSAWLAVTSLSSFSSSSFLPFFFILSTLSQLAWSLLSKIAQKKLVSFLVAMQQEMVGKARRSSQEARKPEHYRRASWLKHEACWAERASIAISA